ncbi:TonB-dependent receptor domain-containing protein [Luteimonas sp. e5]
MKVHRKKLLAVMVGAAITGNIAFAQTPAEQQAASPQPPPSQSPTPEQTEEQDSAPPSDTKLDAVVVVGSRFAGTREEGMAPVNVLSQESIAETGAISGDELLQAIPQVGDLMFNNTDTAANLNAARGDVGSINLRNLGTGNTLLLVNGRRVVDHSGTQTERLVPRQTGNMNAIPLYGVDRTEVLLGGASALYGSDAVAGVINVVMDTRFEGFQVQGQYGGSEGTDFRQGNINFKAGKWFNNDRTRITVLGGQTRRSDLPATEREYSAYMNRMADVEGTPFEGLTAFDGRISSSAWGAFQTVDGSRVRQGGTSITSATGYLRITPTDGGCVAAVNDDACIKTGSTNDRALYFNAAPQRNLLGSVRRNNIFSTIEHDINDEFVMFGEASYYDAEFKSMREQAASLGAAAQIVSKNNYYNPLGAMYLPDGSLNPNRLPGIDAPEEGLDLRIVRYRATDSERPYTVDDKSYRALVGVRGMLGSFDWESAILYSAARTRDTQFGSISNTLFAEALGRSDPSAYNPFAGGNPLDWTLPRDPALNADAIASFSVPVVRVSRSSLFQVDSRFIKDNLFSWRAGNVGLAFGVEWRRETLKDDRDDRLDGTITYTNPLTGGITSDVLGASPSPDNSGHRSVASGYVEFAVPLVSPDMNIPLVRALDMQLAGRYERYSDFGSVAKPKVALAWDLFDGLMFRANWSQSFLAPNIMQMYSTGTTVSNTRTDYYVCEADIRKGLINGVHRCTRSYSTVAERSGNRDLKPEEAETWAAGFVFQPKFLPASAGRLTLTADYWSIKQDDVIGILGEASHLALDYLLRMQGSYNPAVIRDAPTDERIAIFEGSGLEPVGQVIKVEDKYLNRLPRRARGLDFGMKWNLRTETAGTFNLGLNATRMIQLSQEPTAEEELIQAAQEQGLIDSNFDIRNAGSLLGINGSPKWRSTFSASWRYNSWSFGTFVSHVDGYQSTSARLDDGTLFRVPSWSTTNLWAEYRTGNMDGLLGQTAFRLTVRNIADRDPPLTTGALGFNSALHNALGRGYYLTITKTFK